jgi:Ala-tRNA(Pro) deacylase
MMTRDELLAFLEAHGIAHRTREHAAVFTVGESAGVKAAIGGAHTKNLFLKDKKGALVLVSAADQARIDLKALAGEIGVGRFSFGGEALLASALGVTPGSVTALALVNDPGHKVAFVLDAALWRATHLNFHPLTNTATTTLSQADFRRFLRLVGVAPRLIEFA